MEFQTSSIVTGLASGLVLVVVVVGGIAGLKLAFELFKMLLSGGGKGGSGGGLFTDIGQGIGKAASGTGDGIGHNSKPN